MTEPTMIAYDELIQRIAEQTDWMGTGSQKSGESDRQEFLCRAATVRTEIARLTAALAEAEAMICELMDADHYDHFETRTSDGEMAAIGKMRLLSARREKGGAK